jgi:hypothetical protein
MPPDIDKARILQASLDLRDAEAEGKPRLGNDGPCRICHDRGILSQEGCVRYCMCRTGREKKREWLAFAAADRAPFEEQVPTLPDAEDLAVRKRGA